ncbi:MAG: hypothetical protein OXU51_08510 [Candidatus Poribacteria bacterium]|nr:hypothetical protein [Candidatus Poribacteria bacterium]
MKNKSVHLPTVGVLLLVGGILLFNTLTTSVYAAPVHVTKVTQTIKITYKDGSTGFETKVNWEYDFHWHWDLSHNNHNNSSGSNSSGSNSSEDNVDTELQERIDQYLEDNPIPEDLQPNR